MSCNRVRNKYAEYLLCIPSMASTNDVAYCSLNTTARTAEPTPTNSLRRRETTNRTVERLRAAETTKQSGDYTDRPADLFERFENISKHRTILKWHDSPPVQEMYTRRFKANGATVLEMDKVRGLSPRTRPFRDRALRFPCNGRYPPHYPPSSPQPCTHTTARQHSLFSEASSLSK